MHDSCWLRTNKLPGVICVWTWFSRQKFGCDPCPCTAISVEKLRLFISISSALHFKGINHRRLFKWCEINPVVVLQLHHRVSAQAYSVRLLSGRKFIMTYTHPSMLLGNRSEIKPLLYRTRHERFSINLTWCIFSAFNFNCVYVYLSIFLGRCSGHSFHKKSRWNQSWRSMQIERGIWRN